MTYDRIRVTPISGAIGAEIDGVDISGDIDDDTFAEIRRAWLDHLVIFFRDQSLDDESLKTFGRRFAPLFRHPNFVPDPIDPDIVRIQRQPGDRKIVGQDWHADTTCMAEPPSGAVLYAVDVPPYGGDTIFANQYLAYETLSDGLKALLRETTAVHSDILVAGPQADRNKDRTSKVREDADWRETVSEHPVVRVHPETGRPCLFVNASYTIRFTGMTEDESRPLLSYLMAHSHRPEFTGRFRWEQGSVAVWDNRCSLHIAVDDVTDSARIMHRVQMSGDRPAGVHAGPDAMRATG
ncbi:MAG: TauD/TfdA family dioxygenase [Alphaproteobacteria bacterium]|nr:TauD/TfdA family dioxygenase [Alphaproteobacteria bacterium]